LIGKLDAARALMRAPRFRRNAVKLSIIEHQCPVRPSDAAASPRA
jgi:hypothetical protein